MKCWCLVPIYLLARLWVLGVQAGLASPGKTQRKSNTLGYFLSLFGDRIVWAFECYSPASHTIDTDFSVFQIAVSFKCCPCLLFNKAVSFCSEDIFITEQQQVCVHMLCKIKAYIPVMLLFQISCYAFDLSLCLYTWMNWTIHTLPWKLSLCRMITTEKRSTQAVIFIYPFSWQGLGMFHNTLMTMKMK